TVSPQVRVSLPTSSVHVVVVLSSDVQLTAWTLPVPQDVDRSECPAVNQTAHSSSVCRAAEQLHLRAEEPAPGRRRASVLEALAAVSRRAESSWLLESLFLSLCALYVLLPLIFWYRCDFVLEARWLQLQKPLKIIQKPHMIAAAVRPAPSDGSHSENLTQRKRDPVCMKAGLTNGEEPCGRHTQQELFRPGGGRYGEAAGLHRATTASAGPVGI
ncbi:unnamed protein product, partial [Pleuronectes platessa]